MPCRRCNRDTRLASKGLCYRCYVKWGHLYLAGKSGPKPGAKKRGPKNPKSQKGKAFIKGDGLEQGKVPESPTNYLPGTIQKFEIMRLRVLRGEMPHHPDDAKDALSSKGVHAKLWLLDRKDIPMLIRIQDQKVQRACYEHPEQVALSVWDFLSGRDVVQTSVVVFPDGTVSHPSLMELDLEPLTKHLLTSLQSIIAKEEVLSEAAAPAAVVRKELVEEVPAERPEGEVHSTNENDT